MLLVAIFLAITIAILVSLVIYKCSSSGNPEKFVRPGIIVGMGDSLMAGNGGRWAGNSVGDVDNDATGPNSYGNPGHCYNFIKSESMIGGGWRTVNLACSDSEYTSAFRSGNFKPGFDLYNVNGNKSQVILLQELSRRERIHTIIVSNGINGFGFKNLLTKCALSYTLGIQCGNKDNIIREFISPAVLRQLERNCYQALVNITNAMRNSGQLPGSYTLLVQTYPKIFTTAENARYPQSNFFDPFRRQLQGCPFMNADLNWFNDIIVPAVNNVIIKAATSAKLINRGVKILNITDLFAGRKLCENTVGSLEEKNLDSWRSPNAVDKSEWINRIYLVESVVGEHGYDESSHPNYWGIAAERNCFRQAFNNGNPREGVCTRDPNGGTNRHGEPNVNFRPN